MNEEAPTGRNANGTFAKGNALGAEYRFPAGQSGNPGGRPLGLTYVGDWLRHLSRDVDCLREALKSNDAAKVIAIFDSLFQQILPLIRRAFVGASGGRVGDVLSGYCQLILSRP